MYSSNIILIWIRKGNKVRNRQKKWYYFPKYQIFLGMRSLFILVYILLTSQHEIIILLNMFLY